MTAAATSHDRGREAAGRTIAALYVQAEGCYFDLPGVDPWDEARDARTFDGAGPVVAHPPCQRWGRFFHGSTRKPHQFKLGDDDGCFAAALATVRRCGGVIEHPQDSKAWEHFGLAKPPRTGGWIKADDHGGWTCRVEQGFYGHLSRKPTWLYACRTELPELRWGIGEQRLHPIALERHGYAKARRIGMMAMVGGKDKTRIREATPPEFRDVLIAIARSAKSIFGFECRDCGFSYPGDAVTRHCGGCGEPLSVKTSAQPTTAINSKEGV